MISDLAEVELVLPVNDDAEFQSAFHTHDPLKARHVQTTLKIEDLVLVLCERQGSYAAGLYKAKVENKESNGSVTVSFVRRIQDKKIRYVKHEVNVSLDSIKERFFI